MKFRRRLTHGWACLFGNWLASPLCRLQPHSMLKNWNFARIAQHRFTSCCRLIWAGEWTFATGSSSSSMPMVGWSLRAITSFSAMRPGFTGWATSTRGIWVWCNENPHLYQKISLHLEKLVVWCGISQKRIIGPIFLCPLLRLRCTVIS